MSKRLEVTIKTEDCNMQDKELCENDLVLALARFGYAPYFTFDGDGIAFTVDEEDIVKINQNEAV